jgi:prevent-host-death family protein
MAAGEFKARCLTVMDRVARDHVPLVITKRGRAVAKLVPADEESRDLFGYMAGTIDILGDIVSPLDVEWEAMR